MAAVPDAPVWLVERHQDDWRATVDNDHATMEECCQNARAILSKVNPEAFKMPIGTRVVCLKTRHLANVHIAMQHGVWLTSDKVGLKINQQVYDEHLPEAGEKVLFMVSINRQRSFCALAEMSGPWTKGDNNLQGWTEAAGNFNTMGTIPVRFTHVKNVANEHFEHISHKNPNQPITNMWNGMHFNLEEGREVVKIFTTKPHFTNVLCQDKRKAYSPFNQATRAEEIDPTLTRKYVVAANRRASNIRSPHGKGNLRAKKPGLLSEDKPTHISLAKRLEGKASAEPAEPNSAHPRVMKRDRVPLPLRLHESVGPTGTADTGAPLLPGQVVTIQCIVDENWQLIPLISPENVPGVLNPRSFMTGNSDLYEVEYAIADARGYAGMQRKSTATGYQGVMRDGFSGTNPSHRPPQQQKAWTPPPGATSVSVPPPYLPNLKAVSESSSRSDGLEAAKPALSQGSDGSQWVRTSDASNGYAYGQPLRSNWSFDPDKIHQLGRPSNLYYPHHEMQPAAHAVPGANKGPALRISSVAPGWRNAPSVHSNNSFVYENPAAKTTSTAPNSIRNVKSFIYQELPREVSGSVSSFAISDVDSSNLLSSIDEDASPTHKPISATNKCDLRAIRKQQHVTQFSPTGMFKTSAASITSRHAGTPQEGAVTFEFANLADHRGSMDGGVAVPPSSKTSDTAAKAATSKEPRHDSFTEQYSGGALPGLGLTPKKISSDFAQAFKQLEYASPGHPPNTLMRRNSNGVHENRKP